MTTQLLNYTTQVPAERTAGEIHALLLARGADDFGTIAAARRPVGLRFTVDAGRGPASYRLDVAVDRVEAKLLALHRARRIGRRYATREQAERTAWRNTLALLRVFFDVAEFGQFEADRLLLPWMVAGGGLTTFDLYRESRPQLPASTPGARPR